MDIDAEHATSVEEGWDHLVAVLDDRWVGRFPRNDAVAEHARAEARLLPALARHLPVEVPVPVATCDAHGTSLAPLLDGQPATDDVIATVGAPTFGVQAADLLIALRRFPTDVAREAGVADASGQRWREHYLAVSDRFRDGVLPLVGGAEHPEASRAADLASAMLDGLADRLTSGWQEPALLHGDLGPDHVLCDDGGLRGVIDWTDAVIGDPAHDLAWLLHGTPRRVGATVRERVQVSDAEVDRALLYHQLGPWYEVEHGVAVGDDDLVRRGLEGVVRRLLTGSHQPRSTGRPSS